MHQEYEDYDVSVFEPAVATVEEKPTVLVVVERALADGPDWEPDPRTLRRMLFVRWLAENNKISG